MTSAQVGDRVSLFLPDRRLWTRRGSQSVNVVGVVVGIDTGSQPGVEIELARDVNGVRTCYATHAEVTVLHRAEAPK